MEARLLFAVLAGAGAAAANNVHTNDGVLVSLGSALEHCGDGAVNADAHGAAAFVQ